MSAGYLSLVPMALIAALAIPLSVIDIREHRLPNRHTYFLIASAIAGTLLASLLGALWLDFASGIAMGIVTAFVGYLLARFGAIGMGDVKLLIAMHICLGWHSPGFGFIFAKSWLGSGKRNRSYWFSNWKTKSPHAYTVGPLFADWVFGCFLFTGVGGYYWGGLVIGSTSNSWSSCSRLRVSPST